MKSTYKKFFYNINEDNCGVNMTSVNKVSNSTFDNIKSTDKKAEIKPNNINYENDNVSISKNNRKKKVAIAGAVLGLITTAASLVYMIGRNPASAAKVLKGDTHIVNEAYKEGERLAKEILEKKGDFKISLDNVLQAFKTPKHKTNFGENIEQLETYMKEKNISSDSEVGKAVQNIKRNLQQHVNNLEQDLMHGRDIETSVYDKFAASQEPDLKTIRDFLDKQDDVYLKGLAKFSYEGNNVSSSVRLNSSVTECPKDVLPNDGVFFHGTKKQGKVYKEGFTPFVSNQLESSGREFGAGVYVTPDVRVAAYFSGLNGSVIPLKLGNDAKVALVNENSYRVVNDIIGRFQSERIDAEVFKKLPKDVQHAFHECLIRQVFKNAGYDAAYIPKGVKSGGGLFGIGQILTPDINEVIGTQQKQLVVFSPEKLEITSRSLKERIFDLKDKFAGIKSQIEWQRKHPLGF